MKRIRGSARRRLVFGACCFLSSFGALVQATTGDAEAWERHLDELERIERIADPLERCLAMPAIPETSWPDGMWRDTCRFGLGSLRVVQLDDIYRLISSNDTDALDAMFRGYASDDADHPEGSLALGAALDLFRRAEAADAAERWVRLSPESGYAQAAAALALHQRGLRERGGAYASRTSPQKFRAMRRYMDRAKTHALRAAELDPGLIQPCLVLAQIGLSDSQPELREDAIADCLKIAPYSFEVWSEIVRGAEPRWGGSVEELALVSSQAREYVGINPLLERIARDAEVVALVAARGVFLDPEENEAHYRLLRPEALASSNRSIADAFSTAARNTGRYRESVALLSVLMLRDPEDQMLQQDVYARARDLQRLGRYEWSLADWDRHVAKAPAGTWNHYFRGEVLFALERFDDARAAFEDAYRFHDDSRRLAMERLAELEYSQERWEAAVAVNQRLIRLEPRDGRYWFSLASLLYFLDREGFEEAVSRFNDISPPDPAYPDLVEAHAMLTEMRAEWGRRRMEGPPEG